MIAYLQDLYSSLKELIDKTRSDIKAKDDDFNHITSCLGDFKQSSIVKLADLSAKNFNEQIRLEDQVFDWSKTFKQDPEVYAILQSNVQLLTDWKNEMKVYIAKSPLIRNS